jgi:rRNA maturation RNase YbeY
MAGDSTNNRPPSRGPVAKPRTGGLSLSIDDPGGRLPAAAMSRLKTEAQAALGHLPQPCSGEVRVRLVGDSEMAAAHEKFSGIPGTTDVLTFDLAEGAAARGEPLDVDILACIDEAARQAAVHTHPTERELLLYVLHGVLHCLGHDDHSDDGYERMHREEDRILTAIGIGPVFSAQPTRREAE